MSRTNPRPLVQQPNALNILNYGSMAPIFYLNYQWYFFMSTFPIDRYDQGFTDTTLASFVGISR